MLCVKKRNKEDKHYGNLFLPKEDNLTTEMGSDCFLWNKSGPGSIIILISKECNKCINL